ncbi:MAG: ribosome biogenesis GTPase Der [Candidatus Omnitrophota bacterium]
MKKEPIVAIIGRPNVGKSCLFNRILGRRKAIVESISGVTRDRVFTDVFWEGRKFQLVDTGGLHFQAGDEMTMAVLAQTQKALKEADIVLFVVDAKSGLVAEDRDLANFIRKFNKTVILVVNKVDNFAKIEEHSEFYELGFAEVYFLSALHNINIEDLLDEVVKLIQPAVLQDEDESNILKVAIVGRPNVGKSSFLNRILKEERVVVSAVPGTTRDTVDTKLNVNGQEMLFIDTAGIKKSRKTRETLDVYSRSRTIEAINRADVCIVLVDAQDGILNDDLHLFSLVKDAKKCCVLAVNKIDLAEIKLKDFVYTISKKAAFMRFAFPVLCSAKKGINLPTVLKLAQQAQQNSKRKIKQSDLNETLNRVAENSLQLRSQGVLKLHYLTQTKASPPTFVIIVNKLELIKNAFIRYLENTLRKNYDFQGSPIYIVGKVKEGKRKSSLNYKTKRKKKVW